MLELARAESERGQKGVGSCLHSVLPDHPQGKRHEFKIPWPSPSRADHRLCPTGVNFRRGRTEVPGAFRGRWDPWG